MTQVVTLERVTPIARYDDLPWAQARIEESATQDGSYTEVETLDLDPVDADPTQPAARNLTTELAGDGELWYRVVFVDENGDESAPTSPVFNGTPGNLYVTVDELKTLLSMANETYADEALTVAVEAARDAVDGYSGTRFYPTTETRYYTARTYASEIQLDDVNAVTSVTVDREGDGSYSETWVEGTDFYLDPPNAAADGRPFTRLVLRAQAGRYFPPYQRNVKVAGSFGWATTPAAVKQAAVLLANRLLQRTKSAPLGVLVASANDMVTAAHLGGIDKDAAFLLDRVNPTPAFQALRLG